MATGTAVVPASAAAPVEATCGAVLTTDAYLSRNLDCTTGLVVAGDLTLDLRGHRLRGPSTSTTSPTGGAGVSIRAGGAVTIINGRIDRWASGVAVGSYQPDPDAETLPNVIVTVQQVTLTHNGAGLAAGDFVDNQVTASFRVQRSRLDRNDYGVSSAILDPSR